MRKTPTAPARRGRLLALLLPSFLAALLALLAWSAAGVPRPERQPRLETSRACEEPGAVRAPGQAVASAATTPEPARVPFPVRDECEGADALLRELRSLLQQGKGASREEGAVAVRILDLLDRSPAAVGELSVHLDEAACSLEEAAVLLATLGASGTRPAQDALLSFLSSDRHPVERRQLAALAFLEAEVPVPELDPVLVALADGGGPLAESAHLVLAAIGRRVREHDRGRFERIQARVLASLEAAREPEQLETALRAVGNLGPDAILGRVRAALGHASAAVRTAAVTALRRIPDPEADRLLLEAARCDPASDVRLATLDVLLRRHHGGLGDPCTAEALRVVLRESAREDASESVRRFAAAWLARAS